MRVLAGRGGVTRVELRGRGAYLVAAGGMTEP
jgi:hypothetical protein